MLLRRVVQKNVREQNWLAMIVALVLPVDAGADCMDRLIGGWELDIDRFAIGQPDKVRYGLREFYEGKPFMRFAFTPSTIEYSQYDREKWSEPQVWGYEVTEEAQDTCNILITAESEGTPYSTPMRLEFDSMGFCQHADGEVEIVDCYVRRND